MDQSIEFYEEIIGLPVIDRFAPGGSMEIAFLGDGETKIELIFDAGKINPSAGPDISWGFEVDSLDDMISFLTQRDINIVAGPIEPNPNTRFIFITDPDGMKIQLVEQK